MGKPRLLDLFCGAGGSAKGYQRAGFYVVGVDIKPQPHYCGDEFHQADALTYPLEGFDAYHASPPCQGYCVHAGNDKRQNTPKLIQAIRSRLNLTEKPFVIENVDSAMRQGEMPGAIMLCGRMFDLNIIRHRWFLTSPFIPAPAHPQHYGFLKRYAEAHNIDYRDMAVCGKGRRAGFTKLVQSLMGIDWFMFQREITEAIPPAYTEYIGKYLLEVI